MIKSIETDQSKHTFVQQWTCIKQIKGDAAEAIYK